MKIQDIELKWWGHSSFSIKYGGKTYYLDPFQLSSPEKADAIFITHSHYDHCSLQDIEKIAKDGTVIVCTADSQSKINRIDKKIEIVLVEPNKEIKFGDIKIKTVPAYNNSKQFHSKSEYWIGYVLQFGKTIVYHAGDTDFIKEMQEISKQLTGSYSIALLPVGGTYTMNADEAVKAAVAVNASLSIPMHYGSVSSTGSKADAEKFVKLCGEKGLNAQIIEKS
jgi:L-ascorbate metabolism protein UlaG (beta-lactamase superfamily)